MNMAFMSIYLSIAESFFFKLQNLLLCIYTSMMCVRTHSSQHMGGQRTDIFLFHLYMGSRSLKQVVRLSLVL